MADATKTVQLPSGGQQTIPIPANCGPVYAPSVDMMDPTKFAVNVQGLSEAITQPLYSYQSYPAAGSATPLVFFQTIPTGTVTQEDTNMQLAGQLPAPQSFLIQGIGVDYLPGIAASRFGAESANGQLNDFYAIAKRGFISLQIGSKVYLSMTSLLSLPVRAHINGVAATADQSTIAASLQSMVQVGYADGPVFAPRPLLIPTSQNFQVSIAFPAGAAAVPSADAGARIGVWLYGTLYRPAQ